jgi:Na+:H+ antiporter, NhaA family
MDKQKPRLRDKLLPRFVRKFIETESSGGLVMIGFLLLATFMANSQFSAWYEAFIYTPVAFSYQDFHFSEPLKEWVKDVLMVFFFLVVAMELKAETYEGFLSKPGQVRLPLLAALGGVIAPAIIFMAFNHGTPQYTAGWAIPTATDIAFALAVVVLAEKSVPASAKIFLLAIAIFDDLMAILIIAFFYSGGLEITPLLFALLGIGALFALNRSRVGNLFPYFMVLVYLWFCMHASGIHTTIAGVIVGLAIPLYHKDESRSSPLRYCMHMLHSWVTFLILPLFAFTASGVKFSGMSAEMLLSPLPMGIALGLFFGKQIGIFGVTWLLVKMRMATLPEGMNWLHLYGVSIVAGIGFTMSLFIGLLAFQDDAIEQMVKTGVIGGSLLASIVGFCVLRFLCKRENA